MNDFLALVANAGDATVSTFRVGDDSLTLLATTPLSGASSALAVDEGRDLVYAAVKGTPPALVTLRLDRTSGVLTEVARAALEQPLAYVEVAHGGRVVLGASYHGGTGYTWRATDGELGEVVSRIAHPHLHCIVAAAGHAYAVSLGADLVAQYALSDTGVLTPLDPPTVSLPAGSGPRHLALDAAGSHAFLVTEFSAEVFRLARDAGSGALTVLESVAIADPVAALAPSRFGADPRAEHLVWGADVHVAGPFVVASERTASTLAVLPRDGDGRLGAPVSLTATEAQPRGFAVTPDGARVLAVGELSTALARSRLGAGGRRTPLDRAETGRGANWVAVLGA